MTTTTCGPLSVDEREDVLADLEDLRDLPGAPEARAVRGLVVDCQDCEEPTNFEWDLLRGNLKRLLGPGSAACPRAGVPAGSGGVRLVDYARASPSASSISTTTSLADEAQPEPEATAGPVVDAELAEQPAGVRLDGVSDR